MSKFQLVVMVILAGGLLVGLLMFIGVIPGFNSGGTQNAVQITMWGTFSQEKIKDLISQLNDENESLFKITYIEKKPGNYENELLNAMAAGNPPDLWFAGQDMIFKFKDKIYQIPFGSFSEEKFNNTFIDAGNIFLNNEEKSIVAMPFLINPMVFYWNKSLFSSFGVARPPQYWDEFLTDSGKLTRFDQAGNIVQSGAALGEFKNVKNAQDILSMMVLQTGNPIVKKDSQGIFRIVWGESTTADLMVSPIENSLRFFNEFSNPKKTSYSWNRSLSNSNEAFVGGSLAMYFGYANEYPEIKEKNPHLDFSVSGVPQINGGSVRATIGEVYSLAVSKTSPNVSGVFSAISKLIEKDFNKKIADLLYLAPTRRDALAEGDSDPVLSVFYKSSIMAKSWLEPNPQMVSDIFQNMIESTISGKFRISEAVRNAGKQLEELYK